MMIMARSLIHSLESTRREYYEANRFAEIFVQLKRAPNSIAARVGELSRGGRGAGRHLDSGDLGRTGAGRAGQRHGAFLARF